MEKEDSRSPEPPQPLVGIGACLTGQAVRYDGSSKPANAALQILQSLFRTRAFCPEVAAGMGVPRPPIQLVDKGRQVRALDVASHSRDYTEALAAHADYARSDCPSMSGYILVKASPSCGYGNVKRFADSGQLLARDSNGIFAQSLHQGDPLLPLADDEHLLNPGVLESFINRVYCYRQWQQLCTEQCGVAQLQRFYSRYKYLVMAHSISSYQQIGPLLANKTAAKNPALAQEFISALMGALATVATRPGHANALSHIAGYLKRDLNSDQRQTLQQCIEAYRLGEIPLSDTLSALRQQFRAQPNAYIEQQVYLQNWQWRRAVEQL